MTALETWLVEMVKVATGEARDTFEPDWGECCGGYAAAEKNRASYNDDWRMVDQKVAILLVQARALECRHLAGELAIKYGNAVGAIIQGCWDRSHKLEAIGMMLAQQWPPVDGSEVMVCRCTIDHELLQLILAGPDVDKLKEPESPVIVCSHCKLPKHGKAGNGPVMVTQ